MSLHCTHHPLHRTHLGTCSLFDAAFKVLHSLGETDCDLNLGGTQLDRQRWISSRVTVSATHSCLTQLTSCAVVFRSAFAQSLASLVAGFLKKESRDGFFIGDMICSERDMSSGFTILMEHTCAHQFVCAQATLTFQLRMTCSDFRFTKILIRIWLSCEYHQDLLCKDSTIIMIILQLKPSCMYALANRLESDTQRGSSSQSCQACYCPHPDHHQTYCPHHTTIQAVHVPSQHIFDIST